MALTIENVGGNMNCGELWGVGIEYAQGRAFIFTAYGILLLCAILLGIIFYNRRKVATLQKLPEGSDVQNQIVKLQKGKMYLSVTIYVLLIGATALFILWNFAQSDFRASVKYNRDAGCGDILQMIHNKQLDV